MADPVKTLTITVKQDRVGASVNMNGSVTLSGLVFLQMTLAREVSADMTEKAGDEAILLQGSIVNASERLAVAMRLDPAATRDVRAPPAPPAPRIVSPSIPPAVLRRLAAVALLMLFALSAVAAAGDDWASPRFILTAGVSAVYLLLVLRVARHLWSGE
jgi:hypothetical protein